MKTIHARTIIGTVSFAIAFGVCTVASSAEIKVQLFALGRHPAPGTEPGTVYGRGGIQLPTINGRGRVAFLSGLAGPAIGDRIDMGIWAEAQAGLQLVARTGDLAFAEDGAEFDFFDANRSTIFSNSGHVVFAPNLRGVGVDESNDHAIFRSIGGRHEAIARRGWKAPGARDGAVFAYLNDHVANAAGDVAFHASLANPEGEGRHIGQGIWFGPVGSTPRLVARERLRIPNREDDGYFSSLGTPRLNDFGELAFWARAFGSSIADGYGIWVGTPGRMSAAAHQGMQPPGTRVGVEFGNFASPGFNNSGQVSL